ncbi:hypothetical protein Stok01_00511 [Sulfurisphaera tokodaii]
MFITVTLYSFSVTVFQSPSLYFFKEFYPLVIYSNYCSISYHTQSVLFLIKMIEYPSEDKLVRAIHGSFAKCNILTELE